MWGDRQQAEWDTEQELQDGPALTLADRLEQSIERAEVAAEMAAIVAAEGAITVEGVQYPRGAEFMRRLVAERRVRERTRWTKIAPLCALCGELIARREDAISHGTGSERVLVHVDGHCEATYQWHRLTGADGVYCRSAITTDMGATLTDAESAA